jgi:hypothetical protein
MPGAIAVARLRDRRPGALYNDGFAAFLESLEARSASLSGERPLTAT